jgi:Ni,Fe-hydrogenase III small subunit
MGKMAVHSKEKVREIYEVLPKRNCGFCGFGSCGQFARAVAEGRASPFGCRQNPWSGYKISEIVGVKVPVSGYGFQPAFVLRPRVSLSPKSLREEVKGLSQKVDDILAGIEELRGKMGDEAGSNYPG